MKEISDNLLQGISNWLLLENDVTPSMYCSLKEEFIAGKAALELGFEDGTNLYATTIRSRPSELKTKLQECSGSLGLDRDVAISRLILDSLQSVSLHYRHECLLQAESINDYWRLLHERAPSSVDMVEVISYEISSFQQSRRDDRYATMLRRKEEIADLQLSIARAACTKALGIETTLPFKFSSIEAAQTAQVLDTQLAVNQMLVASEIGTSTGSQLYFEPALISGSTSS